MQELTSNESFIQQAYENMQFVVPNGCAEYKPSRIPSAMVAAQVFWQQFAKKELQTMFYSEISGEMVSDFNGTFDGSCFIPDNLMGDLTKWGENANECVVAETLSPCVDRQVVIDYYTVGTSIDPYRPCMPKDLKLRELVVQFNNSVMGNICKDLPEIITKIQLRCSELLP